MTDRRTAVLDSRQLDVPENRDSGVLAQATKFRADLEDSQLRAHTQMADAYNFVMERLADDIGLVERMIQERLDAGLDVPVSWLHRQKRYQNLLTQAKSQFGWYGSVADEEMSDRVWEAVDRAYEDSTALIEAQLPDIDRINGEFARLPNEALTEFQAQMQTGRYSSSRAPVADLFYSYGDEGRQIMDEEITAGLAQGKHPSQVMKAVQARLGEHFINRAMTTIRTETYRAYREANRRTFEANSDIVPTWVWNAYLGDFTCVACWAMHGTEFPVDTPMGSHPNCRCTMIPKTKSWADLGLEGMEEFDSGLGEEGYWKNGEWIKTRSGSTMRTGEERFAELPEATQRKILGPRKFDQYQGGMRLSDMVKTRRDPRWGTTRTVASVDDAIRNMFDREDLEEDLELLNQEFDAILDSDDPEWLKTIRQKKAADSIRTLADVKEVGRLIRNDIPELEGLEERADAYMKAKKAYEKQEKKVRRLETGSARPDLLEDDESYIAARDERDLLRFRLSRAETKLKYPKLTPENEQKIVDANERLNQARLNRRRVPLPDFTDPDAVAKWQADELLAGKEVTELTDEVVRLNMEYKSNYDLSEPVLQRLRQIREMGPGGVRHNVRASHPIGRGTGAMKRLSAQNDPEVQELFEDTLEYFPRDWVENSARQGEMLFGKSQRGYHLRHGPDFSELTTSGSSPDDLRQTMIHEIGHRMEYTNPELVRMEREFYDNRTNGERLKKLKTLFPNSNYGPHEVTRPDGFFDPYIGSDYGGRVFEVLTMGVEAVLTPRGVSTGNRNILADPDMLDFILGMLGGK